MTENNKREIVTLAKSLVGRPYKYGAEPEEAPEFFDCSSFIQFLFKNIGIDMPRSAILQAADKKGGEIDPTSDVNDLEIGDLIFTRSDRGFYRDELFDGRKISIGHVAVYLGDKKVAHAKKSLGGVAIESLSEMTERLNYEPIIIKRF